MLVYTKGVSVGWSKNKLSHHRVITIDKTRKQVWSASGSGVGKKISDLQCIWEIKPIRLVDSWNPHGGFQGGNFEDDLKP